jgi:hypothetical protein
MMEWVMVEVLVVPISWVSDGGLVHTFIAPPMLVEAVVVVLVVPVSWVSQGGLEQTLCTPPISEEAVVAVLVVPVSWVSQGGLEQTMVTVPGTSPTSVEEGCSEVGEARKDTGRSCTGWASTPLGVVMRVTWVGWFADCNESTSVIDSD